VFSGQVTDGSWKLILFVFLSPKDDAFWQKKKKLLLKAPVA
jgi:hypothetical protein